MSYIAQTLASIEQQRDQELQQAQQRFTQACDSVDSTYAGILRALHQRKAPSDRECIRLAGLIAGSALGLLFGELFDSPVLLCMLPMAGLLAGHAWACKLERDSLKAFNREQRQREAALRRAHEQDLRSAQLTCEAEEMRIRRKFDERLKRALAQYDADVQRHKAAHAQRLSQDCANQAGPLFWMTYHDGLISALRDAPRGIANIRTDIALTFWVSGAGFQVNGRNAAGRELFRDEFLFHAAAQPELGDIVEVIGFTEALAEGLMQKLGELCERERFDQRCSLELRREGDAVFQLIYHGETRPASAPAVDSTSAPAPEQLAQPRLIGGGTSRAGAFRVIS